MKDHTTQGTDERLNDLFVPDTLLPSQYFDRVARRADHGGEFRLMLAILEDAVDVYRKQAGATDARRRALFDDAESWIESDDRGWLFSFENICLTLGIEPEYLRKGLRAWKQKVGAATRGTVVRLHDDDRSDGEGLAEAISY